MRKSDIEGIYRLSPLQEGLLFHEISDASIYVVQSLFKVCGDLDMPYFRQAWEMVARRHTALRTSIHWRDVSHPVQLVHRRIELPWHFEDWRTISVDEQERRRVAFLESERQTGFDLANAPLLRVSVFRCADTLHDLVISFHHIILDGWSWPILLSEVRACYRALYKEGEVPLMPARPYGDYIAWLSGQDRKTAESFWREALAGFSTPTLLGIGRSTAEHLQQRTEKSSQRAQLLKEMSLQTSAALKEVARRYRLTVNTICQGVWALLLSRYSGEEDVIFGTVVSGRSASLGGIDSMVGLLINTIPVRTKVPFDRTVIDWLNELQEHQIAAREYEHASLVDIHKWSGVPPEQPLFESLTVHENYPDEWLSTQPGMFSIEYVSTIERTNYPISIETGLRDRLSVKCLYSSRFDQDTIERMLGHYQVLLEGLISNPEGKIGELPMLTDAERHQLLVEWNDTDTAYPLDKCMHELFEEQVCRTPDAVAVIFEQAHLSYAQLNKRANQLAHYLRSLGAGPEVLVALCIERSVEMIIGLLGILKAGAAYVPLDPEYPKKRLQYMLEDSSAPLLITQDHLLAQLPEKRPRTICLDRDQEWLLFPDGNPSAITTPDNLAYVIYTSGSTGQPKGVMVEHQAIQNRLRWMQDTYQATPADRVLQKTSFAFDVSVWEFFWALGWGASLVLARPGGQREPGYLWQTIQLEQISIVHFVPSMMTAFLEAAKRRPSTKLRVVVVSGEALPRNTLELFVSILPNVNLQNLYGPTEAAVDVTNWSANPDIVGYGPPIGRPISNMRTFVLDRYMQPAPIGVAGELYIGGVGLARGYLRRPDMTAERFIPDPFSVEGGRLYRTGDLCRYLPDGNLEFVGRLDEQVKVRGFRIEPAEIEYLLSSQPGVKQAVVVAREDVPGERRLVGYVVVTNREEFHLPLCERILQERLPKSAATCTLVTIDAIPLSADGKIDHGALPVPDRAGPLRGDPKSKGDETEALVSQIVADVLGLNSIGADDNFFDLGLHSLLAIKVMFKLQDALAVAIPVRALFDAPTVEGLSVRVREARQALPQQRPSTVVPQARSKYNELSFAQERLWFLYVLDRKSTAYNVSVGAILSGSLNSGALQKSVSDIVQRHEALRTVFSIQNDTASQTVYALDSVDVSSIDLSHLSEQERNRSLQSLMQEDLDYVFDLENGPLFRFRLVRLSGVENVLLISIHHIATDGWSMGVFFTELASIYAAHLDGRPHSLNPMPIQYIDYAIWQRRHLTDSVLREQLDYWRVKLANLPAILPLPTDRPRPAVQIFQGASIDFSLSKHLSIFIKAAAREFDVTPYMLLMAVFKILLFRYTNQEDIVVGSPVANRNCDSVENLIGFFVNTLALRTSVAGNPSFAEFLVRVRTTILDAYAHQELPFERLVAELKPERTLSHQPLFQTMFGFQNAPLGVSQLGDVDIRVIESESTTAKFDLELTFSEGNGQLNGRMEYSKPLFNRDTIERMLGHYQVLLEGLISNPEGKIGELPMLTDAERHQLLVEWNDTDTAYPLDKCMHELFEEQVCRTPDAVAVIFEQAHLSYAQLNKRANQLAHYLRSLGAGPEVLVALCIERSVEMIIGLLGILKAGAAYVPLDPEYPKKRLQYMLEDSSAPLLITQDHLLAQLPEKRPRTICLDRDQEWLLFPDGNPSAITTPDNLAYVIYTSGSTGQPKGVMVEHQAIQNRLRWMQDTYQATPADRVLQKTSFAFDVSVWEFFWALGWGASLVLARPGGQREPGYLWQTIQLEQISIVHFVPSMMTAFLEAAKRRPSTKLRVVVVSGEALPRNTLELFVSILPNVNLQNLYGPTEAAVDVTNWSANPDIVGYSPPIGRPISNMRTFVLDRYMQPAPIGVAGELYIGGVGLARGYLRRPDMTAERFIPDPFSVEGGRLYRTGDLCRYLPDGNLEFVGRLDEQVKVRGFRIEPAEIEHLLSSQPGVKQAVVVAREDVPGERRLVGYVVADLQEAVRVNGEADGGGSRDAVLKEWQAVYDVAYGESAEAPDFVSWNSSYTGAPISEEQMREWLRHTTSRIARLLPRRVLEIGCGVGLLLRDLAQACQAYTATDFSQAAISRLRHRLASQEDFRHVKLMQCQALDFSGFQEETFDTVILNSVVQYFPDIDYLVGVIKEALGRVDGHGRVFVGDVRNLDCLRAFHCSVEISKASAELSVEEMRRRIARAVAQERELVIDPRFFLALQEQLPRVGDVEIQLKRGTADNELTRYRYDVVLHTYERCSLPEWQSFDWQLGQLSLAGLKEHLSAVRPPCIRVRNVPNNRVLRDYTVLKLINTVDASESVQSVLQAAKDADLAGESPDSFYTLGEAIGYTVRIGWTYGSTYPCFDVELVDENLVQHVLPPSRQVGTQRFLGDFSNRPSLSNLRQDLVSRLFGVMREQLPHYMVPAALVSIDDIPLTPNGKVDRKALPAPEWGRGSAQSYVAPRNEAEQQLSQIWAEVLGLERVGIDDNFFDLGGDSILAIQMTSRANRVGISIAPRDIFRGQTISGLMELSRHSVVRVVEQGQVSGTLLLTPIQHWYFEQRFVQPSYWNMAMGLEIHSARVDLQALDKTIIRLLEHHDALRSRFVEVREGWQGKVAAEATGSPFRYVDLSGRGAAQDAEYAREVAATQTSLVLAEGPLLRAVYFDFGLDRPGRLLLVAHHLVIDGVSWRILLEDLASCYAQLSQGEVAQLPPKTTSYQEWAEALSQHVGTQALAREVTFWLDQMPQDMPRLPVDFMDGENTVATAEEISIALSQEETEQLISQVPSAYNTQINDVLLTALLRSLHDFFGADGVCIALEGHGREHINDALDTTRTVGWFTTIFPVFLSVPSSADVGTSLKTIKEQLRQIPNRGIGYGLLRYLHEDLQIRTRLMSRPQPQISFNYLGRFDRMLPETSEFTQAPIPLGASHSPLARRAHVLDVNGAILSSRLTLQWTYNSTLHQRATIEAIAARYLKNLRELISHCTSPGVGEFTASDFPHANLSKADLDTLFERTTKADIEGIYRLSPLQEGLLFHEISDASIYVVQSLFKVCGDLDMPYFRQAWEMVARRHTALRTSIHWRDVSHPVQLVHRRIELPWHFEDWRTISVDEQERRRVAFLESERQTGFDLANAPLLRVSVFRCADTLHDLVISFHHIILDGWSWPILLSEVRACYRALYKEGEVPLMPARPYGDYIAWLSGQDRKTAESFWREALAGFSTPTLLGIGRSTAEHLQQRTEKSSQRAQLLKEMSLQTSAALKEVARRYRLTVNTICQGVWALLLSRYSGEEDVIFGTVVSGRSASLGGIDSMVGLLINTIPVRTKVPFDRTVIDWLNELQEHQIAAREYEHASLVDIHKWSGVPPEQPLFESLTVHENYPDEWLSTQPGMFSIEYVSTIERTNYPISIETGLRDRLSVKCLYSSRFDQDTIERMLGHYQVLLEGLISNPEGKIGELPMLTDAERHQLLVEWNDTDTAYPLDKCMHELFEEQVCRTPDAVAVIFEQAHLSYAQLNKRANQLAHYLRSLGAGPEVLVALCIERSVEMIIGLLGILKAGAAYVPLDPEYPKKRLQYMLEDSSAPLLITQDHLLAQLPEKRPRTICLDRDQEWLLFPDGNPSAITTPDNLAYVIYTSGSTGQPKGVMVEHANLTQYLRWAQRYFEAEDSGGMPLITSFAFDATVTLLFSPLLSGRKLYIIDAKVDSAQALVEAYRNSSIALIKLTPAHLAMLSNLSPESLRRERSVSIVAGAEQLNSILAAQVFAWGATRKLVNEYGPTEATVGCATFTMHDGRGDAEAVPIGRPINNARIYILDGRQRLVPIGVTGELYIGGTGVSRGYWRRPSLTAERFLPDEFAHAPGGRLYRTGDLGRHRLNGDIEYVGRIDDQAKIRGIRVEPSEIEWSLGQHKHGRNAVVVPHRDNLSVTRLVAYIPRTQTPISERISDVDLEHELRQQLSHLLPAYMMPALFVFLDDIPLTPNGKVDRKALPAPEWGRGSAQSYVAPRNEAEQQLSQIWAEVLGLERVGIDDNFFDLGGDSILAIQMTSRANRVGISIAPRDIFRGQTISGLMELSRHSVVRVVEQGQVSGTLLLTPIQHWYFEQRFVQPSYWNMAMGLEIHSARVDLQALDKTIIRLLEHHDALRSRFVEVREGWQGKVAAEATGSPFRYVDLSGRGAAQDAEYAREVAATQTSLVLAEGPLLRAVYFDFGLDRPGRLLLVAHHLVIDGVSWRILLEDLASCYAQLSQGEVAQLPPKTTSYQEWAEALSQHVGTQALAREVTFWLDQMPQDMPRLPVDFMDGENTVATAEEISIALSQEETEQLISQVPSAYNTQINDVLLTALLRSLHDFFGADGVCIALEGHGREHINDALDTTRTVGWFTTIFPVFLSVPSSADVGTSLKTIKEQLRQIPNRGIGYGLLRYLHEDLQIRTRLMSRPQPQISFNYLGRFDRMLPETSEFTQAPIPLGASHSPLARRAHVLDVNGAILSSRLTLQWTYNSTLHQRATIEAIAARYLKNLRELISHCTSPGVGEFTASDFPHANLSKADLDTLFERTTKADIEGIYRLSPLQEGLLFHEISDASIYVVQSLFKVCGDLDMPYFRQAWEMVARRHTALRTSIHWRDVSHPVQLVHRRIELPWHFEDWRTISVDEQERRRVAFLESERQTGFDLANAPLLRVSVFRCADTLHDLVISFHHIILDGWSWPILLSEVRACYRALYKEGEVPLMPARPYGDYIAWLSGQDRKTAESFWREALAGFSTPTLLGIGRSTAEHLQQRTEKSSQRAQLLKEMSLQTSAALKEVARRYRLTVNTICQGVWALLLSRYSGEEDVIFGTVVSGRSASLGGIDSMVGLLINTIPVRTKVPFDRTVIDWLNELQEHQIAAREYEHASLVDIHKWSGVPPEQPLFESLTVHENYPDEWLSTQPGMFSIEYVSTIERTNYPISIETGLRDRLSVKCLYSSRFDQDTIERMLGHYQVLLEGLISNPEGKIGELPMLTDAERHQLLVEWNDTDTAYPLDKCMHELFEEQVCRTPDAVAVIFEQAHLSYAQLNKRANQLAHYLRSLGAGPEVLVALCIERSVEMIIGLLGILKAGAAYVPLDPEYPKKRLQYMLEDSSAPLLITQDHLLAQLPEKRPRTICLDRDQEWLLFPDGNPSAITTPDNLAYVIYTSGSTGQPKGVMNTHRSVFNWLSWMIDAYRFSPLDVVLHKAPLGFVDSLWELLCAPLSGARLCVLEPKAQIDPLQIERIIEQHQITVINFVPSALSAFLELPDIALKGKSLRHVMCSGEALPTRLEQEFHRTFNTTYLHNLYGQTETAAVVTHWTTLPRNSRLSDPPIGRPIANTKVYILDRHNRLVPFGVRGELYIGGLQVARGYLNEPELTSTSFLPDPFGADSAATLYRTGDLVRINADGVLEYITRRDSQVKIRGTRIELGEIENIIKAYPGIEQAAAIMQEHNGRDELVAYVVTSGADTNEYFLRQFVRMYLPPIMVPSMFQYLESMPLTPTGKIDRRSLPRPVWPHLSDVACTRTNTEVALARIWSDVLNVPDIGLNDNFLEMGANSILSMQVLARARRTGLSLSLRQIQINGTLAELARAVDVTAQAERGRDLSERDGGKL